MLDKSTLAHKGIRRVSMPNEMKPLDKSKSTHEA